MNNKYFFENLYTFIEHYYCLVVSMHVLKLFSEPNLYLVHALDLIGVSVSLLSPVGSRVGATDLGLGRD